jgi:hypothetical protein
LSKNSDVKLNRLADSGSPYLLQHADNPVDWYPWSDEAFEKARKEDKPVFLSIGYSTCHWCHVMEKESFSDPEVAELMNEVFVCVKVDREERPDVDHMYMTVCQLLTGSGGWPLTIVLTPDKKPFFAGTYFPRGDRYGRPGMLQVISRIRELWSDERETVNSSAEEITGGLKAFMTPDTAATPPDGLTERAFNSLKDQFDEHHGGFGSAPKFPVFSNLLFLLRYWHSTGDQQALTMVLKTLDAMRTGGIFDQVGYGLHRYSTDEKWFAPHFEKMLYDQALAVITCTEAFCATQETKYRKMAEEILTYALRDLQSPEGGFYSAEDADSEGEEGRFYTWTAGELGKILSDAEIRIIREVYNITDEGNFLSETGVPGGRNILHLKGDIKNFSGRFGMSSDEFEKTLDRLREKLLAVRAARVRPLRDDKIMTDWNGLMIAALAKAGRAFGDERFIRAAEKAFSYIQENMYDENSRLLHLRYRNNERIPALLDDHAYLLWGLLELHQSRYQATYLTSALQLASEMISLFQDTANGGFFLASRGDDPSFSRLKPSFDGPIPSGNSVAAMTLLRLGRLTAQGDLEEEGHKTLRAFASEMAGNPAGLTHMISALNTAEKGTAEVIIAGDHAKEDTKRFLHALHSSFLPDVNTMVVNPDIPDPVITKLIPFASDLKTIDGKATAYVCRNFVCLAPTADPERMLQILSEEQKVVNP